ncbi:phage tail protein [Pseudomonas azotoformans]|nr:phage tail protein [Pseudomonas azotoformans]QDH64111.1 phage tail protein [Pseudomonas azotoformans]
MIDQNSQFFAILTAVGEAKQANATALGLPWTFAQMGVGDANLTDPIPNRTQTRLINEWRRAPVNQVRTDPANPNIIITEQVIPADVGGKWIREIGLYDADGDLVAVANCAPSFKPLLVQGTGKTQIIRMNFIVANTASVVLKIDPAIVLATREYVDLKVAEEIGKLDLKQSVVVATLNSIALGGLQTLDGVALEAGARVLVRKQQVASQNGIYIVSPGNWVRSSDADTSAKVTSALTVGVERGATYADSVWTLTTDGPVVIGTTALNFELLSATAKEVAGVFTSVTVDKFGRVLAGTAPTTLAGHGITDTYTKDEIAAMIAQASALPVGSMIGFPVNKVAPGFLELDGSVKSAAAYPDLATFLGGAFNKGDEGAGNFRLPESRAEFLRGWDHGRGVDVGRGIGSLQAEALKTTPLNPGYSVVTGGATTANVSVGGGQFASRPVTELSVGSGSETRPRNLAVMWCIKAWNAPINQGNIDIAALAALAAQATENNQGTAKVATQSQVDLGVDDATIVTPKKLRAGFRVSLGVNGYICFPSWMGGLVWQWGNKAFTSGVSSPFAMPFPVESLIAWAVPNSIVGGSPSTVAANVQSLTTNAMILSWTAGGTYNFFWFALGR